MKIYNPNREERAFLYQEAQDLEPLMKELGSLSVMVEEIGPKKTQARKFRVTFMVAPESVGMRVRAQGPNLYEATIAAKEETLNQLNAIVNSMPRQLGIEGKDARIPSEFLH